MVLPLVRNRNKREKIYSVLFRQKSIRRNRPIRDFNSERAKPRKLLFTSKRRPRTRPLLFKTARSGGARRCEFYRDDVFKLEKIEKSRAAFKRNAIERMALGNGEAPERMTFGTVASYSKHPGDKRRRYKQNNEFYFNINATIADYNISAGMQL